MTTLAIPVFSTKKPYVISTDLAQTTCISSPKVCPHISCERDAVRQTVSQIVTEARQISHD